MGLLGNIIKNAVGNGISNGINGISRGISNGISNGINNAVSSATERIVEPKVDEYANSVAGTPDKWNELLPGFPIWPYGGKNFEIEVRYADEPTGSLFYEFRAEGATIEELNAYAQLLKKEGFVQKYAGSDNVLYKEVGGEYLGFSSTEAFNDLDIMCIALGTTKSFNEV